VALAHHTLPQKACEFSRRCAVVALEIRKVGAPLAGLIASERLKINTRTAGLILFVFLLGSRLF
jgi:hypothetical protein